MEERLAKDVAVVSYLGVWCVNGLTLHWLFHYPSISHRWYSKWRKKNTFNNIINYFYQTSSVVQALFLAMALYPEVQKKAQAEIDSVVGPNRLPNFEDRPSLPYINALVKESMRWHVPAALGAFLLLSCYVLSWQVPKLFPTWLLTTMNMMDTIFQRGLLCLVTHGQLRTTITSFLSWLSLFRSILHDPESFNNPMVYQPERYLKDGLLNPDYMDTNSVVFGFGRRLVLNSTYSTT